MMAITTSSSIRVKPMGAFERVRITRFSPIVESGVSQTKIVTNSPTLDRNGAATSNRSIQFFSSSSNVPRSLGPDLTSTCSRGFFESE